ncbi:MAG: hybrid sensor histidine kinase/response regulator, partial [Caldimonas sp.]
MTFSASFFAPLARFLGAHTVPERDAHEGARALQRMIVCGVIASIWIYRLVSGHAAWLMMTAAFPCVVAALAVASLLYWVHLRQHPGSGVAAQYFFLLSDPPVAIGILVYDPTTFAFLNPFLLAIVVRCGIRYGLRTFWTAWALTVVAALTLLPANAYWRSELEITLSFFLMLSLMPLLFASLLRRIHSVRALEEERARVAAIDQIVTARSGFLAKVSHEIRSPLQSIISALDLYDLRHAQTSSPQDELIARIRRSSAQLNTQIRDLLTLAKGEAGRLEIRPEPFDVSGLMHTLGDVLRERARAKALTLYVDAPSLPMFFVADSARIDQILTNLAMNSIRYTEAGHVRLSLRPYDPTTRLLHFVVADTGPGIPADMLPTLMAPDHAQTGAERRGEGSGIGLAIVRTLVDHLGGKVEVTSTIGLGTTFRLEIPAEPVRDEEVHGAQGSAGGRVLVVDDRDDVLEALASVVDELGFACDRASSAAVGANLLATRTYEVALLDLEMPHKGGVALAADTRRGQGPNRSTRFVAMSASVVSQ